MTRILNVEFLNTHFEPSIYEFDKRFDFNKCIGGGVDIVDFLKNTDVSNNDKLAILLSECEGVQWFDKPQREKFVISIADRVKNYIFDYSEWHYKYMLTRELSTLSLYARSQAGKCASKQVARTVGYDAYARRRGAAWRLETEEGRRQICDAIAILGDQ